MTIVDAVHQIVDDVLWPASASIDRADTIPPSHLQALADAGLFGVLGKPPIGLGLQPVAARQIQRALGRGCAATTFVYAQHHGLVGQLNHTKNLELHHRWQAKLCGGQALAGIMFAHLRRPGPPVLEARRRHTDDGWVVSGHAPWATSWGLAEVFLVAARAGTDQIVWFVVERDVPKMKATLIELPVLMASRTARIHFDDLVVDDADVVSVMELDEWTGPDLLRAASPNPAALGVGDRALVLLDQYCGDTARRARGRWDEIAGRAEDSNRQVDRGEGTLAGHSAIRAQVMGEIVALSTALLAACGGRGVELAQPAQRLCREAMFYVVQAQTEVGRDATLRHLIP